MTNIVDRFLNQVTMYRLVLYYCCGLLALAFCLGFAGLVPASPPALSFSCVVIFAVCIAANRLACCVLRIPASTESVFITAAILALVLDPVQGTPAAGVAGLALAAGVAVLSKFVFAWRGRHIFNPVAVGAIAAGLLLDQPATWWAGGNLALLPAVVTGGLLVVRKVQRFGMLAAYIAANLAVTLATTAPAHDLDALTQAFVSSPLLFAGFAMLTEPLTAPQAPWARAAFGAVIGGLSSPNVHIGTFYFTPELAFLAGNLFAFAVLPQGRVRLALLRAEKVAAGCYEFVFAPSRPLAFAPGQYMDFTLDVPHADNRGNRRPFTIASSPLENEVRLGVKFYAGASAFKRALFAMKPGDVLYGSCPGGDFTLPPDPSQKLAFIAGGIGITPFRSMVRHMIDAADQRDVVLLYGNNRDDEVAYGGLWHEAARDISLRTVLAIAAPGAAGPYACQGFDVHRGWIDSSLIRREVPDFRERIFYLSGPRAMVVRFGAVLKDIGVPAGQIRTDWFPGFA